MTKPVHVRFRHEGAWGPKGTEAVLTPGVDRGREIYGDTFEVLRYEDGSPYELTLKEQAIEHKEAAEDVVVDETTVEPKGAKKS